MSLIDERSVRVGLDMLRPLYQIDDGDLSLSSIDQENGIVYISLTGACDGCVAANAHIAISVADTLQRDIPEIKEVKIA